MDKLADVIGLGVLAILLLPFLPFVIVYALVEFMCGEGCWKILTFITLSIALYILYYVLLKHHILLGA